MHVRLTVYNLLGQEVRTLVNRLMDGGSFVADWNSTDKTGKKVSSGIYLYILQAGDFQISKKMVLLK